MNNNAVLRRIRYIFDFRDPKMVEIFGLAGLEVTSSQVTKWLKKEGHFDLQQISDTEFATFLNGLIIDQRGKKEGPQPKPEEEMNNNIIFRKMKIVFDLKNEEIIQILALRKVKLSNHELSAFFRKPTQSQYRPCADEYLEKFLHSMQILLRDGMN